MNLGVQNNCQRFKKNIRQVKAWKVFELNIFQNLKKSIKLALWKRTCSLIVDWRSTLAQNVVIHLVNQDTWGAIWSPTLGRKYTNVQNYSFGLAEHLQRQKPYKCPQCDYACSQAGTLRDHIKTHSLEKPNQCKWCDFSSITKSSLSQHLLTYSGERSHHCKECGSSFSRAGHLKRHYLNHSCEKPHKCKQCD